VLAQLVADGRQVVCAVEDAALADLLCRRLPLEVPKSGKRITLVHDRDGDLTKLPEAVLPVPIRDALLPQLQERTAG